MSDTNTEAELLENYSFSFSGAEQWSYRVSPVLERCNVSFT
jgi:hypothetical protein